MHTLFMVDGDGGTRIMMSDDAEVTSSQAAASHIVDLTQHQHETYQPQYDQAQQQEGEAQQQGGLLTCRFYRGSIATWHADYGATLK